MDYRKQSPEMCACVSSHLEDQVLISWFLAISKLAFTGTFTGTPLYFLGVTTWFTTKFAKQINSAIVPLKEARYRGTDMGQIFITLPLGEKLAG